MSVIVAVTREDEAQVLCRWGWWMARAVEESLVILWLPPAGIEPGSEVGLAEDLPGGLSDVLESVCRELAPPARVSKTIPPRQTAGTEARVVADPDVTVHVLPAKQPLHEVLGQVRVSGASHLVLAGQAVKPRTGESLARKLFWSAPCNTVLIRLGESEARHCTRILAPTSGGPHAAVALHLGERLARAEAGSLTALYVEQPDGELADQVGSRILARNLAAANLATSRWVESRVEVSDDRLEAISDVAAEGHDLLLLGASNVGTVRRLLFGTVPGKLLAGSTGLTVAVVRRRWRLLHHVRHRLGRWLDLTVPQLARAERVALYELLESGSVWRFDFLLLMAVSTAIAALGLIENSAAVVIGAMLVAPLMTPILGTGLSLVQGNLPMLRRSAKAIVLGYAVAFAIAFVIGWLVNLRELTPELAARGGPTLLDMAIGYLAGLAAAYCLGRPGLLAALPGVAIAAALVPPIATTGVSLAWGQTANARGAAMLFGSNVVAIVLGAASSLYGSGVRGTAGARTQRRWVSVVFLTLLVAIVGLAFPLGSGLFSMIGKTSSRVSPVVRSDIGVLLSARGQRLDGISIRKRGADTVVEVEVASPTVLEPREVAAIADSVRARMGPAQRVSVVTRLVVEAPPGDSGSAAASSDRPGD